MPSSRRAFLGSLGAALPGLAGCLDAPTDGDAGSPTDAGTTPPPTATPADATLGDTVAVGDVSVTLSTLVTAHSVRYLTAPDAVGVTGAGDDQFVFVDVAVRGEGRPPAAEQFAFLADGDRYVPGIEAVGPARVDAPVSGLAYGDATREGFLAFRVPAPLDADDVAVVLEDAARWAVPPSAATPLRSPPPAFAASVEVPDSVAATDPVPVRLDVTNEGPGSGVFRGAINHQGPLYSVETFDVEVPAGETVAHETSVDYYLGEATPPARVQFAVVGPDLSRFVEVVLEGGGTPDGTHTGTAVR
jgi:hypothetical protein